MHTSILSGVTQTNVPVLRQEALVQDHRACLNDAENFDTHMAGVNGARSMLAEIAKARGITRQVLAAHFTALREAYIASAVGVDTSVLEPNSVATFSDVHRGCAARLLAINDSPDDIDRWIKETGVRVSF